MNIAYAFLTKIPNITLIKFAESIYDKHKIDIYILTDDEIFIVPSSEKIEYIKTNPDTCRDNNICCLEETEFENTKIKDKTKVSLWDKSIYYFTHVNTAYDYVWFIDDKVFIPSDDTIINIDNKYYAYDLLTTRNNISKDYENYQGDQGIWYWKYAIQIFDFPCYSSITKACRMSKTLLSKIKDHAMENGFIPFYEFSFNTIAMKSGLGVCCPQELSTIEYDTVWTHEYIKENKENLFYPVQFFTEHQTIRDYLKDSELTQGNVSDNLDK